jgi:hypothetical protein
MRIQKGAPQLPQRQLPPAVKAGEPLGPIDSLGSAQLGSIVTDLGLGLAQALAPGQTKSAMGVAMSGLHLARGVATIASARKESGLAKNYRLGSAAAEFVLAAGHLAGAAGGAWGLPLLLAGTAAAYQTDKRFRESAQLGPKGQQQPAPRMTAGAQVSNLVDASLGLAQLSTGLPGAAGVTVGASHAARSLKKYAGGDFSSGYGHAMVAIGQIAGALGSGSWWLAPVLGGLLTTNLEDHRRRTWL